jgi:PAS domain S-box-containing protein
MASVRTDAKLHQGLLRNAEALAFAIPAAELNALQFTGDDVHQPTYRRLSKQLRHFAQTNGPHWIQTFSLTDSAYLTGPSSLAEDHPAFLPAGSPLPLDVHQQRQQLRAGKLVMQGPLTTPAGDFYVASAPIIHPRSGPVLGVSVYADARDWKHQIRKAQKIPMGIAGAILIVLLSGQVLTKLRSRRKPARHLAEVASCALICLLLTLGITRRIYEEEDTRRRDAFYSLAQTHAEVVHDIFRRMDWMLHLFSTWIETTDTITEHQFKELTQQALSASAVQGIGWLPRVPLEERTAFEQELRQNSGQSDFQIWELNAEGHRIPALERPFYHPVQYIFSNTDTELHQGFNTTFEPMHATAQQEAAQIGRPTATPETHCPVHADPQPLIHIFNRVESERHPGQIVLVLSPDELLATAGQQTSTGKNLTALSFAEQEDGAAEWLSTSGPQSEQDHGNTILSVPIFAFGQCYVLRIRPSTDWWAQNHLHSTPIAAIGGLLMTLLLTALTRILANRRTLLHKQVEERTLELTQAQEYNRALFDSVKEALFIHHPESGQILDINRSAESLYGMSRDKMLHKSIGAMSAEKPEYTQQAALDRIHDAAQGTPQLFEWKVQTENGTVFPVEVSLSSARIHGELRVIACVRDIHERRQYEEQLRASEQRLSSHIENTPLAAIEWDMDGNIVAWNPAAEKIFGYTRAEILGTAPPDFGPEAAWEQIQTTMCQTVPQTGGLYSSQTNVTKDGRTLICDWYNTVLTDEGGTVTGIASLVMDITEQAETEKERAESARKFKALVSNLPGAIYRCSLEENHPVLFTSQGCHALCGYHPEDLTGNRLNWGDLIHPNDRPRIDAEIEQAIQQQKTYEYEYRIKTKAGDERWLWERGSAIYATDGTPQFIEGLLIDVTEHHQAQTQAQATLDSLSAHIAILNQDGRILAVNRAWEAFAIQQGAATGTCSAGANYLSVCESATEADAEDAKSFSNGLRAVLARKQNSFEMEYPCETRKGVLWFSARITAFPGADDYRVAVAHENITQRRNAEEKLAKSEKKLRGILENSTNIFYSHTPEHVLTYISPQIKEILGYDAKEAEKCWLDLLSDHPVNAQGIECTEKAIRTGKAQPAYELQLVHKDEHPVWVEVREAPVVENGRTVAIIGSLTDITARKAAEETLHARHRELERFNKAAVGRELRMGELKKEINQLCRTLGQDEPYPLYSQEPDFLGDIDGAN